jgi:hypothetical protein
MRPGPLHVAAVQVSGVKLVKQRFSVLEFNCLSCSKIVKVLAVCAKAITGPASRCLCMHAEREKEEGERGKES